MVLNGRISTRYKKRRSLRFVFQSYQRLRLDHCSAVETARESVETATSRWWPGLTILLKGGESCRRANGGARLFVCDKTVRWWRLFIFSGHFGGGDL